MGDTDGPTPDATDRGGPLRRRPADRRRPRRPVAVVAVGLAAAVTSACATTAEPDTVAPAATSPVATAPATAPATGVPATDAPEPSGPPPTTGPAPLPAGAFDTTVAAFRDRVTRAGLAGGTIRVVRHGTTVVDESVGSVGPDTPLAVASTAKWLTAATLATLVDDGTVFFDDPVARWIPAFSAHPTLTIRHLLTHTSGLSDADCIWQTGGSMAACADRVAAAGTAFAPGSAFSYGNGSYHVAGRVIEVAGGADFVTVVRTRLTDPVGMTATTWPGAGANPSPAAGVRTTVDDYSRFLAMLLAGGTADGRRILSAASVDELTRNQVERYDTSGDAAVAITRIPRYALGAWPDRVDDEGRAGIVSGNGARGFYPWIDVEAATYGIVGVQDDRGAEVAVPASQAVAALAWDAVRP